MPQKILIEKEIIERCRSGSLQDFKRLVELTSPFAYSVAFRTLADENAAEDIVQETMITIWKTINKIRTSESFMTWMYRIVINKCYDELRQKKRKREVVVDENTWQTISNKISENPSSGFENREIAQIINRLADNLSPKQRAVFVLSDLEEMSPEEISGITGISRVNVKANLHFARKKIGEMIKKYF